MRLVRLQPDPHGDRYMFEMFACLPCGTERLHVRTIPPDERQAGTTAASDTLLYLPPPRLMRALTRQRRRPA